MIKTIRSLVLTISMITVCLVFDALLWGVKKLKGYVIFPGG